MINIEISYTMYIVFKIVHCIQNLEMKFDSIYVTFEVMVKCFS